MKKYLDLTLALLIVAITSMAQQERIVADKKVFICTMSDRDTFKTAAEGCKHWAQKHLESGYKYQEGSATTQPNGAVFCLCKKQGQSDNDQQGMIMGIIICPENASELNEEPANFESRKCQCYETYVSHNGKCVKPEDVPPPSNDAPTAETEVDCKKQQGLTPAQEQIKNKVNERLKQIVEKANKDFAADPAVAAPYFSDKEIILYGGKGLFVEGIWNRGYGHAIERMTADAVTKDKYLNSVLHYNTNIEQTKGLPDFRGKGKLPETLSFDITTNKEVTTKKAKGKDCWEFITYNRLAKADGSSNK
jgi:hypothetical protein